MTEHFTDVGTALRLAHVLASVETDFNRRLLVADVNRQKTLLSPDVPLSDRISRLQNLTGRLHRSSIEDFRRVVVEGVAAMMVLTELEECRVAACDDPRGFSDGLGSDAA